MKSYSQRNKILNEEFIKKDQDPEIIKKKSFV